MALSQAYFDTSALVKRYVREESSARVRALLDAIHVAAALVFEEVSGARLPFVTGDSRQAEATRAVGLEVIQVG
jgi:predicted nucleic acid-binding protein